MDTYQESKLIFPFSSLLYNLYFLNTSLLSNKSEFLFFLNYKTVPFPEKNNISPSLASSYSVFTCIEVGQLVVNVHQAVSTNISLASIGISFKFFPGRLGNRDVVVLEPDLSRLIIDVGPVVPRVCLSFVNKDCVQAIRHLQVRKRSPCQVKAKSSDRGLRDENSRVYPTIRPKKTTHLHVCLMQGSHQQNILLIQDELKKTQ